MKGLKNSLGEPRLISHTPCLQAPLELIVDTVFGLNLINVYSVPL